MHIMMSAAGSAVARSIINHLESLGHHVSGHDSNGFAYIKSPPVSDPGYFWFIETSTFDLYLPFLDEEFDELTGFPRSSIVLSPDETISIFKSKVGQSDAMRRAGLPVPVLIWDIMLKPDRGRGGRGVFPFSDGYMAQQRIDGDEYTIDTLTDRDGAFLFAVPRLRIQANGVSVIGKIVMDDEIIDLAKQVVSKFKFAGPINIQVIRERDTGKLYIIEVNPRLSGSCMFTVMAGFDILDATLKLWEGKPFEPPVKIEDGLIIRRHYVEERL